VKLRQLVEKFGARQTKIDLTRQANRRLFIKYHYLF